MGPSTKRGSGGGWNFGRGHSIETRSKIGKKLQAAWRRKKAAGTSYWKDGAWNRTDEIQRGDVFGRLVVLYSLPHCKTGKARRFRTLYCCLCSCGQLTPALKSDLTGGKRKSCGCTRGEFLYPLLARKLKGVKVMAKRGVKGKIARAKISSARKAYWTPARRQRLSERMRKVWRTQNGRAKFEGAERPRHSSKTKRKIGEKLRERWRLAKAEGRNYFSRKIRFENSYGRKKIELSKSLDLDGAPIEAKMPTDEVPDEFSR